jgi:hypothetical protein
LIAKSRKSLLYSWQLGLMPGREHSAYFLFIHTKPARQFGLADASFTYSNVESCLGRHSGCQRNGVMSFANR